MNSDAEGRRPILARLSGAPARISKATGNVQSLQLHLRYTAERWSVSDILVARQS